MAANDQLPIIVGTGQATWREPDLERTPVDALEQAARLALQDAGGGVEAAIDAVVNVRFIADTNPEVGALFPRNPGAAIATRLGLGRPALYLGAIGGNTPQYLVNRCAEKLLTEQHRAILLTGAELMATFFNALRNAGDLSLWAGAGQQEPATIGTERDGLTMQETLHGLYEPINTYPLFENALRHRLGRSVQNHIEVISQLSSNLSAVAAQNPLAWRRDPLTAEEIATVGPGNRYIGYPYTRAMNAVLEVDMSAAIVLTTVGRARELGIPQEKWIYLRGGVDVNDIWYPGERANWHSSPAIELGWQQLSAASGLGLDDLSHFDIYSCFPSAVEIACDALGLPLSDARGVTVTGGLPFFGGPGNNYSLHAIAEMAARLQRDGRGSGLVTANGLYLTKHSLGLYSTEAGEPVLTDGTALQAQVDAGPRVAMASAAAGEATVETWTVAFGRQGPERGIVIARNDAGERIIANSDSSEETLRAMIAQDPIGERGRVRVDGDINRFEFE
ncbi:MAG: acetyl-CoA acetyltransferase [Halioglobus sp.]|nr:acetyl-CoA acetyltransferase [Halioglobus sp.]